MSSPRNAAIKRPAKPPHAHVSVATADVTSANTIIGLRPTLSLTALQMSRENASVEIDSTQLLFAAASANSCASIGIRGCTQIQQFKRGKST